MDVKVSRLHEENAQITAERDRLSEEKNKWLQTQQAMKEENAKLAKDLESKYSSSLSQFSLKFVAVNSYHHDALQL
jgi:cell shape-determining protein MreC